MDLITILTFLGLGFLVWDCIEVGRNDAANIVNAVFGARILRRRLAVGLAGAFVVLGAALSSPVIETARKGIFDPATLSLQTAIIAYISVYLVDTVLLYTYSAFGMPVSTTASLIFALLGASLALAGGSVVHWDKVWIVLANIIVSIALAGLAGFLIQRVFRAAIRDRIDDRETILLHGPWICGLMLTWLGWFMILKGMGSLPFVQSFRQSFIDPYTPGLVFLTAWGAGTLGVHLILSFTGPVGTRYLFPAMALLGMVCLAFAFGQNDLANCASPGLSAFWLWEHQETSVGEASQIPIPWWVLLGTGCLLVVGMFTENAQRVTRAQVNTGSQFDRVALYAPGWCRALARWMLRLFPPRKELAPPPRVTPAGKKLHYDALRAAVISSVSAGIIAFASSQGLPISTTYVSFAAVLATGMADRVLHRGDADLKVGRAIWVVFSWFAAAVIAIAATAAVARMIFHWELIGVAAALGANLTVRFLAQWFADRQEEEVHLRISRETHRLQPHLAALNDQAPSDHPPETNPSEDIE